MKTSPSDQPQNPEQNFEVFSTLTSDEKFAATAKIKANTDAGRITLQITEITNDEYIVSAGLHAVDVAFAPIATSNAIAIGENASHNAFI